MPSQRRIKVRDAWFVSQEFKVLRFWDNDVLKNTEGVVEVIQREVELGLVDNSSPSLDGKGLEVR